MTIIKLTKYWPRTFKTRKYLRWTFKSGTFNQKHWSNGH